MLAREAGVKVTRVHDDVIDGWMCDEGGRESEDFVVILGDMWCHYGYSNIHAYYYLSFGWGDVDRFDQMLVDYINDENPPEFCGPDRPHRPHWPF